MTTGPSPSARLLWSWGYFSTQGISKASDARWLHEQFVGGAVVRVNSYTNKDLELVRTTIKVFVKPKTIQSSISFAVRGPVLD